ncbi:MAG: tRNA (adenosine(37)-N6)-dimethylallyltransferase MiaA [Candidatus Rifleibacteriota bacterium]
MDKRESFPVLAILGPTASGKSKLALKIAQKFGCEIINCDSRQIYKEMNIGTAKPGLEEQQLIKHHLFDLITPDRNFSAGDYVNVAVKAIKTIRESGNLPLLTGGTGFYYNAIANGLPKADKDPEIAKDLQSQLESEGFEFLQNRLKQLDPQAYSTIDLNNPRRVLRALEVILMTNRPFAENLPVKPLANAAFLPVIVTRPRSVLHYRIEKRVEQMFKAGLENEVSNLFDKYGSQAPGLNSIGYAEWSGFFSDDKKIDDVFNEIVINSRQYARRQEIWFRKRPGRPMNDLENQTGETEICTEIENFLNNF